VAMAGLAGTLLCAVGTLFQRPAPSHADLPE
jgi:hypothetical protein